jgi:hypothetical protein
VFLEFENSEGEIKRLHELVDYEKYQVVLTQQGGLTRYRMNDIVQVRGFYRQTPMLEFVGRANAVCDLAGEKLHEEFVRTALTPLMVTDAFIVLPNCEKDLGYTLFVDARTQSNHAELASKSEDALCTAHHYKLARTQNQIAPLQVQLIENLAARLRDFSVADGVKLGDIKESVFVNDPAKATKLLSALGLVSSTGINGNVEIACSTEINGKVDIASSTAINDKTDSNPQLRVSLLEESIPQPQESQQSAPVEVEA